MSSILVLLLAFGPAPSALAQSELLSAETVATTIEGKWIIDPSEDTETETNCETDYLKIWINVEDGRAIYYSQWASDDEHSRSAIQFMGMENGELYPAIILKYDNETRLDEDGEPLRWGLFMPDRDHFYWTRLGWKYGQRTAMRLRCPDTAMIG